MVFFDNEERSEVDAQWHAWLDKRQAEIDEANRVRSAQEQEAKRYQQLAHLQELQAQALAAQAAAAERSAESLAVISGATSLWEVELIPPSRRLLPRLLNRFSDVFYGSTSAGTAFFPYVGWNSSFGINPSYKRESSIYVMAYGRTSEIATDKAIDSSHRLSSRQRSKIIWLLSLSIDKKIS